jgi:hypothetical protein
MQTKLSMALITCPECNREVSSSATACPHCAYPIAARGSPPPSLPAATGTSRTNEVASTPQPKQSYLKRILIIAGAITGLVVLIIGGCSLLIVLGTGRSLIQQVSKINEQESKLIGSWKGEWGLTTLTYTYSKDHTYIAVKGGLTSGTETGEWRINTFGRIVWKIKTSGIDTTRAGKTFGAPIVTLNESVLIINTLENGQVTPQTFQRVH